MSYMLIETQICPPLSTLWWMARQESVLLEAQEHYQKRSFRNRIYLNSPKGQILISVPLQKGKNAQTPITDVQISYDSDWVTNALRKIQSCYGNAPYFAFYYDGLSDILKRQHSHLWQLNLDLLQYLLKSLRIRCKISHTESYEKAINDSETLDLRNHFSINSTDLAPNAEYEYESVFAIDKETLYRLSSLDLLMCYGPEATVVLSHIFAPIS